MFQMTPHECAFLQPGYHGSGLWEDPGEPGGPSTRVGNMEHFEPRSFLLPGDANQQKHL